MLIVLLALKVRLGLELFRKTDVGVVGGGVYVLMNQEKNTILLPGNITWEGLQRGEPETVMIEEGVIRPWAWTKVFSPNVHIVRFSSGCVSVYDLRRFSGGYYQQDEPNKPLHGTPANAPSSSTEPQGRRP